MPTATRCSPRCATRSSRRPKDLSYFHRWQPTDMVIWDNWRCLHSVSGMAPEHGRCMHRTTIAGDYGLGRFEDAAAAPS